MYFFPTNDKIYAQLINYGFAVFDGESFEEEKYLIKDHIPYSILKNPPDVGRASVFVSESGTSYFSLNGGIGKYSLKNVDIIRDTNIVLQFSSIKHFSRNNTEFHYLNPMVREHFAHYFIILMLLLFL